MRVNDTVDSRLCHFEIPFNSSEDILCASQSIAEERTAIIVPCEAEESCKLPLLAHFSLCHPFCTQSNFLMRTVSGRLLVDRWLNTGDLQDYYVLAEPAGVRYCIGLW